MFKVNNKNTRTIPLSSGSIANFEQAISGWETAIIQKDQDNHLITYLIT